MSFPAQSGTSLGSQFKVSGVWGTIYQKHILEAPFLSARVTEEMQSVSLHRLANKKHIEVKIKVHYVWLQIVMVKKVNNKFIARTELNTF